MGHGLDILIDSNIFIASAAHAHEGHPYGRDAAELHSLASQLHYRVLISHGTRADIARAGERRETRERELSKYLVLREVPIPAELAARAGFPARRSVNDQADLEVLATFQAGLGAWLVSNDIKLRTRAKRVAANPDAVYSLTEAIDALRRLVGIETRMPAVTTVQAYELDLDAPIFASLKAGYPPTDDDPGFAGWWRTKVVPEHRQAIILGETRNPEGLAVLHNEDVPDYGLAGRVTKLCTFKVADDFTGTKRGEALLKAVLDHVRLNGRDTLFVEVLPSVDTLPAWLEGFGFYPLAGASTKRREVVLVKQLVPPRSGPALPPLDHAVRYGPGEALVNRVFLVPIQTQWHHRLLPEADQQLSLDPLGEACGNAIRKAYLCHSPIRRLATGDLLGFIQTGSGTARATCTGVVEGTMVSSDAEDLAAYVGPRTVYSVTEIKEQCDQGPVLAIRFRLDRVLPEPWPIDRLRSVGVAKRTPQSIASVNPEGVAWVRAHLDA